MTRNSTRQAGFTLFEILVAVSIFAVIGVMTMTNLIQVGRSGERISAAQQQLASIQFALGYLGKDLTQAVNRKVRDQYGDEQEALTLSDSKLVFTRNGWANLLQQPRSQLQRVAYRLEDEQLIREYWLHLDQGFAPQPIRQSLIDGVEELEIRLLTSGTEALGSWPVLQQDDTNSVSPIAIEFTLQIEDFGEVRRIYELNQGIFDA